VELKRGKPRGQVRTLVVIRGDMQAGHVTEYPKLPVRNPSIRKLQYITEDKKGGRESQNLTLTPE